MNNHSYENERIKQGGIMRISAINFQGDLTKGRKKFEKEKAFFQTLNKVCEKNL